MNKDKIKGQTKYIKGQIRQSRSWMSDNGGLEFKGRIVKTAGKTQIYYGELKDELTK